MKDNKKISINLFLFVFLFYSFVILITDYITYAINPDYIISLIISFIIVFFVSFLLVKKKKILINKHFSKYDFAFFSLLFLIFIISFVYPDRTFDTINYHIYIQENPFGDKLFDDFFPARWINSYTYAFSDRFAYFFRYIFGYRVGILFNYFIITTIYYEVKKRNDNKFCFYPLYFNIINCRVDGLLLYRYYFYSVFIRVVLYNILLRL